MSDGVEAAREQRNLLERLMARIPGFKGFMDRELRREVDKLQREHLAKEVEGLKRSLRGKTRAYTDAGRIADLTHFDRLDRRLDGLGQAMRFADYGQSGLFDPVKIREAELERIYQFDLSFLDELEAFAGELAAVPPPGGGDPGPALAQASDRLEQIEVKWAGRETVIGAVVQTTGGEEVAP